MESAQLTQPSTLPVPAETPVLPHRRLRAISSPVNLRAGAYYGASDAKEFFSWAPSDGSADADLLSDLPTLRARSRDTDRNNGIAAGGYQTLLDNVIGTGPRLNSMPDYKALGKTSTWAEEWAAQVESLWASYWRTPEVDAANIATGASLTAQAYRAALCNGEAIALPLWLYRRRSKWRTRFQLIEADRLSTPTNMFDGQKLANGYEMRGGIEINQYGEPMAYWIRKSHPGDMFLSGGGLSMTASDWERIEATFPFGRKRLLHLHDRERSGQSRGRPMLSAVLSQFRMLDAYQRTELQSAVANSMVAAFVETPLEPQSVAEMLGSDFNDPNSTAVADYLTNNRQYIAPLKGAAVLQLPPGTKMSPYIPGRPSDQFAPFIEAVVRHIGASLGLPYELLIKDFSKTNYSSARAALLEAWRFFAGRRQWIEDCWLRQVYKLWLEDAISQGLVDAPDYYDNAFAYESCMWIWPGRGWIDPVKEAQAAQLRVDGNFSTLRQECAEQGQDWQESLEQRAREKRRMKDLEQEYDIEFDDELARARTLNYNNADNDQSQDGDGKDA